MLFLKQAKVWKQRLIKYLPYKEYPTQFPKQFIKKRITGKNIKQYEILPTEEYILYFEDVENFEDLPFSIREYLLKNKDFLKNRAQIKRSPTSKWWKYTFPMHKEYNDYKKIYCSRRAFHNTFVLDETAEYLGFSNMTIVFDTNVEYDLKYILTLLNSKVLNFRYKSIGKQTGGGSFEYFPNGVGKLPIPQISKNNQESFIDFADKIMRAKKEIQKYKKHFESLNAMDKIEIKEEIEKLEVFIEDCIREIDEMVYDLYGLSEEEVAVVEGTS